MLKMKEEVEKITKTAMIVGEIVSYFMSFNQNIEIPTEFLSEKVADIHTIYYPKEK